MLALYVLVKIKRTCVDKRDGVQYITKKGRKERGQEGEEGE